jgi:hypothetical protein
MLDLKEIARQDTEMILQGEFSQELVFLSPNGSQTATVRGLCSNHEYGVDPDTGMPANLLNVHCSISEISLTEQGYTTRNASDKVDMITHFVSFTDARGVENKYKIVQSLPDKNIGMLLFLLAPVKSS